MSWFKSFWKKPKTPSMGYMWGDDAPPASKSFSNFTPSSQRVLALARQEADRFNHNFVGTEHLLLGLIKLGRGCAMNVLQKMGLDLETICVEVERQVGTNPDPKWTGNIAYTPRVKKVLDLATKEAKALNHAYIGTEHLLLGLLREGGGIAARILRHMGLDIEMTRQAILHELDPNFVPPGGSPSTASPGQPKSASRPPQGEPVDIRGFQHLRKAGFVQNLNSMFFCQLFCVSGISTHRYEDIFSCCPTVDARQHKRQNHQHQRNQRNQPDS